MHRYRQFGTRRYRHKQPRRQRRLFKKSTPKKPCVQKNSKDLINVCQLAHRDIWWYKILVLLPNPNDLKFVCKSWYVWYWTVVKKNTANSFSELALCLFPCLIKKVVFETQLKVPCREIYKKLAVYTSVHSVSGINLVKSWRHTELLGEQQVERTKTAFQIIQGITPNAKFVSIKTNFIYPWTDLSDWKHLQEINFTAMISHQVITSPLVLVNSNLRHLPKLTICLDQGYWWGGKKYIAKPKRKTKETKI